MYSLLQERNRMKDLVQQFFLLGIAGFTTEKFAEIFIQEKSLFPESYALESAVFLTIWVGLDVFLCSILRSRSFLKSFANQVVAGSSLTTLAIAWGFQPCSSSFIVFYSSFRQCWDCGLYLIL